MTGDNLSDMPTGGIGADDPPVSVVFPIILDLDGDGNELLSAGDSSARFDTDGDGKLSASDAMFGQFRPWQDRNGDGVAATAEITTLAASSIASLSLSVTPTNATVTPGSAVAVNPGRLARADGTQGMFSDAALAYFSSAAGATAPIDLARQSFDGRSKKYQIMAQGGQLFVALTKAKGELDPGSGRIGPSALLSFKGKTIGMLAPIILDLDGDGIEMVARGKSKASFDMDGDGNRDDTGWIGKGDGFLVIDRDNDGLITGAAELSFLAEKPGARSDLDALAALDSNRDRKLDPTDLRFGELKVWVDSNRNGFTDAGELKTFQELNIASIDLAVTATQQKAKLGDNILLATGSFTLNDGTVRSLGDAALAYKPGRGAGIAAGSAQAPGNAFFERSRDGVSERLTLPDLRSAELPEDTDPQSELTSALRAGLGENRLSVGSAGLSLGVPAGVNPFDYFAERTARTAAAEDDSGGPGPNRREMPGLPAATGGGEVAPALPLAGVPSIDELVVARMVQTMAAFGRSQGEGEWHNRDRDAPRFDYFA